MPRFIRNSPGEFAAYIKSLERRLVVFDGRPGVGKSYVARAMRDSVPCEHVDADAFLILPGRTFISKLNIDKLGAV
jgi:chloramphenicol 3-O-phosphotransferase